jgi:outer membrane lipoprotein LolB
MTQDIFMIKTFLKNNLIHLSIIPILSILTACQSLRPPRLPSIPATTIPTQPQNSGIPAYQPIQFSITGKIGVRTLKQSGSAFYAWSQDGERFAIDLTGALGIGQTHIEGIPDHVSLQSAKTGYIEASTPEELLQRATGWQAPISYLPHWINGEPVDPTSKATRDPQNRLVTLEEGGWDVTFYYDDQISSQYPNRLIMNQIASQQPELSHTPLQNNRVILTIKREINAKNDQSDDHSAKTIATP